jgi:hypothetical protein
MQMTNRSLPQLKLLAAAANAEEGAVTADGHPKTIAALIKEGFLISVPQADGPSRLLITMAGREAIAAEGTARVSSEAAAPEDDAGGSAPDVHPRAARPKLPGIEDAPEAPEESLAPTPAPKGKIASLVDLLREPGGTTVAAMMEATGWQAHSVRGALSGAIKKGLGLAVISEKTETGRIYRLAMETAA